MKPHDLPHHQVAWLEEIVGRDGQPMHRLHAARTPVQSVVHCRTGHRACAARLTFLDPHPGGPQQKTPGDGLG